MNVIVFSKRHGGPARSSSVGRLHDGDDSRRRCCSAVLFAGIESAARRRMKIRGNKSSSGREARTAARASGRDASRAAGSPRCARRPRRPDERTRHSPRCARPAPHRDGRISTRVNSISATRRPGRSGRRRRGRSGRRSPELTAMLDGLTTRWMIASVELGVLESLISEPQPQTSRSSPGAAR